MRRHSCALVSDAPEQFGRHRQRLCDASALSVFACLCMWWQACVGGREGVRWACCILHLLFAVQVSRTSSGHAACQQQLGPDECAPLSCTRPCEQSMCRVCRLPSGFDLKAALLSPPLLGLLHSTLMAAAASSQRLIMTIALPCLLTWNPEMTKLLNTLPLGDPRCARDVHSINHHQPWRALDCADQCITGVATVAGCGKTRRCAVQLECAVA